MTDRLARLRKLAGLQQTLKDFHEARNGSLLADAIRARRDAEEIASIVDSGSPLAAMFTDVYARRIVAAETEENESLRQAAIEARRAADAGVRLKRVEQTARKAESAVERAAQERDALERATRRSRDPK